MYANNVPGCITDLYGFGLEHGLPWRQQRVLDAPFDQRIAEVMSVQQDRAVSLAAHWSQNGIPVVRLQRYEPFIHSDA